MELPSPELFFILGHGLFEYYSPLAGESEGANRELKARGRITLLTCQSLISQHSDVCGAPGRN